MNLTVDLKTSENVLRLKNPVLTASGTFGYGVEFMPYGDLSSLGGLVVKGVSLLPRLGNPLPRVAETSCGMLNAVGLQNDGVEAFLKNSLPKLPWQKTAVIANLYATSLDDFARLSDILSNAEGLSALEVNISCPNVSSGGMLFGQDPELAFKVTEAVKKSARKVPVIIKLSPNVTDIVSIAKACEAGGADMISCVNTLTGMAVDLQSRKPLLSNIIGGLSGPAIKPVALRCVWQVAQAVQIPVIGLGGISSARDVLEFILVGASAVQVGTMNFVRPDAVFKIVEELPKLCAELGITNLAELRGTLKLKD